MDTRSIAATLRQHIQQDVMSFTRQYNQTPGLVLIGFGEDQPTIDIARIVGRNAPQVGIRATTLLVAANIKPGELRRQIEQLNADPAVHAISLQLPMPKHLEPEEVASWIAVEKEVEGEHPLHQGRAYLGKPSMAAPPALSAMRLLSLYNINPAGRHVVIIGRNMMIGRPLASLMIKADATVSLCHSQTRNLQAHTRQAEILVTAAGQPELITADMVRPGAVVIDYGINYVSKAQIVGDVDFESVSNVAGAITPMPGGTGPLTVICLMENILKAARLQQNTERERANLGKPQIETEQRPFQFKGSAEYEVQPSYLPSQTDVIVSPSPITRNGFYN